jgi:outer membrane immunogenic protein
MTYLSLPANRFGWVAGAGIEAALWGNWTAKVQYLYMDLGHLAANISAVLYR